MGAQAPKAAHKSAAVVAAICLLSAVAGFNNHAISNTLFYKSGQLYLHAEPDGKEVCLSVRDKEPVRGAKLQVWNCDDMVGKKFTKTYTWATNLISSSTIRACALSGTIRASATGPSSTCTSARGTT